MQRSSQHENFKLKKLILKRGRSFTGKIMHCLTKFCLGPALLEKDERVSF